MSISALVRGVCHKIPDTLAGNGFLIRRVKREANHARPRRTCGCDLHGFENQGEMGIYAACRSLNNRVEGQQGIEKILPWENGFEAGEGELGEPEAHDCCRPIKRTAL